MLKSILGISITCTFLLSCSQHRGTADIKNVLLKQLHNTHDQQEWFAPTKNALADLSAEQSHWKDTTTNHSIAELVAHITFWYEMNLKSFKGQEMSEFQANNDSTFTYHISTDWSQSIKKLDSLQTQWEIEIHQADVQKLTDWSDEILNMASHTAYHTGQIVFIRKQYNRWK